MILDAIRNLSALEVPFEESTRKQGPGGQALDLSPHPERDSRHYEQARVRERDRRAKSVLVSLTVLTCAGWLAQHIYRTSR